MSNVDNIDAVETGKVRIRWAEVHAVAGLVHDGEATVEQLLQAFPELRVEVGGKHRQTMRQQAEVLSLIAQTGMIHTREAGKVVKRDKTASPLQVATARKASAVYRQLVPPEGQGAKAGHTLSVEPSDAKAILLKRLGKLAKPADKPAAKRSRRS